MLNLILIKLLLKMQKQPPNIVIAGGIKKSNCHIDLIY